MKVLFLRWSGYGMEDMIEAFKESGLDVMIEEFPHKADGRHNSEYEDYLESVVRKEKPDFLFTFNYFPVISQVSKKTDTKAVFWVYDSPYVMLYSYTIIFPQNYVFIFDKEQYFEFHKNGINTVYYLPLAANPKRQGSFPKADAFKASKAYNRTDIAFVGAMYREKHQFFNRMEHISDYTRGYLEGIMTSQMKVYGYNFIRELMTEKIMDDMHKDLPMETDPEGVETKEYLYAQYVINREITGREREALLKKVGEKYKFDLYTNDESFTMPNCINHGRIDNYSVAPYVYNRAKINLNFTLRSITTGIPYRAFEVMASRGFLLTNYQADFDDCYVAGEDYVYFDSEDDLMAKIEYYLTHEDERAEIARNGYERTLNDHTYVHRIKEILNVVFNEGE